MYSEFSSDTDDSDDEMFQEETIKRGNSLIKQNLIQKMEKNKKLLE